MFTELLVLAGPALATLAALLVVESPVGGTEARLRDRLA
jgi:hypothetical protein